MKNIHILPTDKPSRIIQCLEVIELLKEEWKSPLGNVGRNIYITNSEEIKEGDWFLTPLNDLEYANKDWIITILKFTPKTDFKKIILTTDQELIKDGVQAIDDEFLEWFVLNPSCEWVEVIKQELNTDYRSDWKQKFYYKLIIPKEEPKQETLEEVAEKWNEQQTTLEFGKPHNAPNRIKAFIEGAKWQQQNSYSEEEVLNILHNYRNHFELYRNLQVLPNMFFEWFEQFKNK